MTRHVHDTQHEIKNAFFVTLLALQNVFPPETLAHPPYP